MAAEASEKDIVHILESLYTTDDEKIILNKFKIYIPLFFDRDNKKINIDVIHRDLGYSQKNVAKNALVDNFDEDEYIIQEVKIKTIRGGCLKENIFISMSVLIRLLPILRSKNSKIINKMFNTIEDIINGDYNTTEDQCNEVLNILKSRFNTDKEIILLNKFKKFIPLLKDKDEKNIKLEDIYKDLGYTLERTARDLLSKHFKLNDDYIIKNLDKSNKRDFIISVKTLINFLLCVRDKDAKILRDILIAADEYMNGSVVVTVVVAVVI